MDEAEDEAGEEDGIEMRGRSACSALAASKVAGVEGTAAPGVKRVAARKKGGSFAPLPSAQEDDGRGGRHCAALSSSAPACSRRDAGCFVLLWALGFGLANVWSAVSTGVNELGI